MPENEDGLDYLRIPYEKIKFGKKLEVQGYGTVFEGEFDDRRVALKQLNITNLGNVKPKLFAEILTISRFRQHPNLVALLGFCDEKINEIILVYEYVSSGNLADKMRKRLTTIQRLEICLGAARGLDYLHTGVDATTPGITHGNIKLSKILLNSDLNSSRFEAKVSSFGLSKILPGQAQKVLESADEVTERVTKESDVYSFGVLLLEVLCGVSELVDTDDYQERHVSELVPKRLEQNKLRKIVHFDIRKEIKAESLETYAKIACQCVLKSSEERPSMAKVVEELEKALRLQGGEVSDVQIVGSRTVGDGAPDGTVVAPPEDGNGVVAADSELVVAGEDDAGEVSVVGAISESTNGVENAAEDVSMQERSFHAPILNGNDEESVHDITHIEDAQKESDNDQEAKEEIIDDLNSDEKSKLNGEREDNNKSKITTTSLESSNGDTSTTYHSLNQEVQNSEFLESGSKNRDNPPYQNQDDVSNELDFLRIPYEKIKFGKKIDIHGYGSMFEGKFDHQQVALKRLNITNLSHIKPNLLSEILTVSKFRQHPNVIALLGFCDEKTNEIILVYEYASSGNLADKMSKHLTTIQRLEICLGAARGLDYLHTGIVHGDIKLSKILLNSHSNTPLKFEAKVSGFGLSKLLPGKVRKILDPTDKAFDVYSFGVLLLEVLCGVREMVDTDDYQERSVSELVPKRLDQNILRTIVHVDIRDEITTESLETYAKIACLCVMKDPEERPTMAQVVEELEKALKLQGKEVSDVHILGSSNGNGLPEEIINEDDQKGDDDGETMNSNIAEKISEVKETIDDTILSDGIDLAEENNGDKGRSVNTSSEDINGEKNAAEDITTQEESFPVPILGGEDGEKVDKSSTNDRESTVESTDDLKLKEESEINTENEVDNESKITTISSESNNGDGTKEDDTEAKEEITNDKNTATEITMEVQSSGILDSDSLNAGKENSTLLKLHDSTEKKPESNINIKEREVDFNDFATNNKFKSIKESESKPSDDSISTSSESSNGDGTAPSDYLLQKTPANANTTKKPSTCDSRNCCYCACWRFFSDRYSRMKVQKLM